MQEAFDQSTGEYFREFFEQGEQEGETEFIQRMDERAKERGHTVVKRAKIGRNEPCPCGSGAKFKKCCIGEIRR